MFVPSGIRVPTPLASWIRSFARLVVQTSLLRPRIRLLASDCVDHVVGVVCALVLGSYKVPSGLQKTGTSTR